MRRVWVLAVATIAVVGTGHGAWAQVTHDVEVTDDAFAPSVVTISVGDSVRWEQTGSNPHTVTADDGSFDSHPGCQSFTDAMTGACMAQGDTYTQSFDEPGEYGYHCRIHGAPGAGMAGTVIVEESPPPADPEDEAPVDEDAPVEDGEPAVADEEREDDELPVTGATLALLALGLLAVSSWLARR